MASALGSIHMETSTAFAGVKTTADATTDPTQTKAANDDQIHNHGTNNAEKEQTSDASSTMVTGLTPEMVFQELKKSGYVDQLRRQLFDAFAATATSKPSATSTVQSQSVETASASSGVATSSSSSSASTQTTAKGLNTDKIIAPAVEQEPSPSSVQPEPKPTSSTTTSTTTATALPPTQPNPIPTSSNTLPTSTQTGPTHVSPDVGSKTSFLHFLATPLRQHVETEHDTMRFQDRRGQHNKLLQLLESQPIPHPNPNPNNDADTETDATAYDWLINHIVSTQSSSSSEAIPTTSTTAGILGRNGNIGKDAYTKIQHVINHLLKPRGEHEDDDDDDDDEDGEDEEEEDRGDAGNDGDSRKGAEGRIDGEQTHDVEPSASQTRTLTSDDTDAKMEED